MKTKFYLFSFLLLAISCKKSTLTNSQVALPFEGHAYSVNNFTGAPSSLRKKLLHEIYLKKKESEVETTAKIVEADFEDIKDNANYNKNFLKLIISYSQSEELFYIPNGYSKAEVFLALGLENSKNKSWVWKNELQKDQTTYLIETSPQEVLNNEKYFEKYQTNTLSEIYPFQEVEISLQVFESAPQFLTEKRSVSYLSGGEHQVSCNYERSIPTGGYLPSNLAKLETFEASLELSNNNIPIVFHNDGQVLKAKVNLHNLGDDKQDFKIGFPEAPTFKYVSTPSNCMTKAPVQEFSLQNKLDYKLNYTVLGTTDTLESFGEI